MLKYVLLNISAGMVGIVWLDHLVEDYKMSV